MLRRELFALDLPSLGIFLLLFALSLGGGPATLYLALFSAHLVLNRFGRAHARRALAGEAIPVWLGAGNLLYLLAPLALLPLAFLGMGEAMRHACLVPSLAGHPDFPLYSGPFDPDHAGMRGLRLGPYGAATAWDIELRQLDVRLFGGYPAEWARRWHRPWLTGLFQLGYLSYYFAPAVVCLPLLFRRRWVEFRNAAATLSGCLVFTYVGYLVVPATGPRFQGGISAVLPASPGWFGAERLYRFLDGIEVFRWDAFPSGHVALGLCALVLAFRRSRRLGLAMLVPVLLLCGATVYMGYHYAVDVLAGIAIALVFAWLGPRAARWWDGSDRP